jgi:hypothetical protein
MQTLQGDGVPPTYCHINIFFKFKMHLRILKTRTTPSGRKVTRSVHGRYSTVHGGYIAMHGGYILLHGVYITVHGSYIPVNGSLYSGAWQLCSKKYSCFSGHCLFPLTAKGSKRHIARTKICHYHILFLTNVLYF